MAKVRIKSLPELTRSLRLRLAILESVGDNFEALINVINTFEEIGDTFRGMGKFKSAKAQYQSLCTFAERLNLLFPSETSSVSKLVVGNRKIAICEVAMGELAQAVASNIKALNLIDQVLTKFPGEDRWLYSKACILNQIGWLNAVVGDRSAARNAYNISKNVLSKILNEQPEEASYLIELKKADAHREFLALPDPLLKVTYRLARVSLSVKRVLIWLSFRLGLN